MKIFYLTLNFLIFAFFALASGAYANENANIDKLQRLQELRYEVFSLKQQLGPLAQESVPYSDYIQNLSARKYNAIAQSYNDAAAKSGFFIGFGIGIMDIYTSGQTCFNNTVGDCLNNIDIATNSTTRITPLTYSANGGYQEFFNHHIGARIYGGIYAQLLSDVLTYNIGNGTSQAISNPNGSGNLRSFYALGVLSADLLAEFPMSTSFRHYIGAFLGINIGIMYYRTYADKDGALYPTNYLWDYNLQVDYSFNLGASVTIFDINRFELALVIPVAYLELPGFAQIGQDTPTNATSKFWRSAIFSLNYKLVLNFKKSAKRRAR